MPDEITTSDVSTSDASTGGAASSAAPAPGSVSEAQSSVPAQIETQQTTTVQTPAPPSVDDILSSLPENDDDLNDPTVQGADIRREMRSQMRVLADSLKTLRPLEGYAPLAGKATPEIVQSRMEMFSGLFAPVLNPLTQQPERDPATGYELYTTKPFIEKANEMNPGLPEQLMADLSQFQVKNGRTGQEEALWQTFMRDALGLDPGKLTDYRNIDKLVAGSSAAITPEELNAIPEQYRDAYKNLPASVRDNLLGMDAEARDYFLAREQREFQRQQTEQQQAEVTKQQEAAKVAEIQQWLTTEQDKYIASRRQEGYAEIRNDLASQVTFSGDEKTNEIMLGIAALLPTALIDPDLGFGTEPLLKALGVELKGFYDTANTVMSSLKAYKAHELGGMKLQAEQAMTAAYGPEAQMKAKLADIALKTAIALGAQRQTKATQQQKLLATATGGRPTPTATGGMPDAQSLLPAGVRGDSAEANRLLAKRAGLL